MEMIKVNGRMSGKRLAINILVPVVGGAIVGWFATRHAEEKYKKLKKPTFSPPSAVFPIAWTTLYTMMGLAKYRVEEKEHLGQASLNGIPMYEIQLGLNFLWSFLFFRWGLRGTALVEMTVLLGAISLTTYEFFKTDRKAGALMIPYIVWVCFALCLNHSIWKMNKENRIVIKKRNDIF